jgi:hypothetical protein
VVLVLANQWTVTEILHEWERASAASPQELALVCERRATRSHELRDLPTRNGVPHVFHDTDSPGGRKVVADAGLDGTRDPWSCWWTAGCWSTRPTPSWPPTA